MGPLGEWGQERATRKGCDVMYVHMWGASSSKRRVNEDQDPAGYPNDYKCEIH